MIDVAIIGAGAISPYHLDGYQAFPDRCRVVAVADTDIARARARIDEYQLTDALAFDGVDAVLASGRRVDLASVCTPPSTHAEIATRLLDAGVATLLEKPMAPSLAECDQILAAAERGGAILSVVAQNRFTNPMMRLKQVLDSGLAGRVLHAQVDSHWWRGPSYYDLWWRGTWASEGGGCTLNHAVHHIDALQWMIGPPAAVQAMIANVNHDNSEVEDLSVALLRFPGGALGQITSSVVHHGQDQQIVFQTERAKIAMPWTVSAQAQLPNGFPQREHDTATERELDEFYQSLPALAHEGHPGQIDDVLTALETAARPAPERHPVLVDGVAGRTTIEIITAIYQAAITARTVPLPLPPSDPFRTRGGLLDAAPRFHRKQVSVGEFSTDEIST
jgi:UDP-N-acetyl-2-amino-2-deoxyglucuronate dehydrogenase